MAGWTETVMADSEYYQKYADELWKALNERLVATGGAAGFIPVPGANIQHVGTAAPAAVGGNFSLRYMQDAIIYLIPSFVRSHVDWETRLLNDIYDGESSIEMWTTTTFFAALNGGTHFRRKTVWGAAFAYGSAVEGDILGPWIIEDIQRAFMMLIWTRHAYIFDRQGENNRKLGDATSEASWAAAKTATEASYAASTTTTGECLAVAHGDYYVGLIGWTGHLDRAYQYGSVTIPDDYAKEVDWYCYAIKHPHGYFETIEFDANGDDVIENKHSLWLTEAKAAACGDAWITATKVAGGGLALPAWMTEPTYAEEKCKGYIMDMDKRYCIARWDVAGGFTYY